MKFKVGQKVSLNPLIITEMKESHISHQFDEAINNKTIFKIIHIEYNTKIMCLVCDKMHEHKIILHGGKNLILPVAECEIKIPLGYKINKLFKL